MKFSSEILIGKKQLTSSQMVFVNKNYLRQYFDQNLGIKAGKKSNEKSFKFSVQKE
jgi:hypothetical protein